MTDISRLRKRPFEADAAASGRAGNEIDIVGCATVSYSSEDPAHPNPRAPSQRGAAPRARPRRARGPTSPSRPGSSRACLGLERVRVASGLGGAFREIARHQTLALYEDRIALSSGALARWPWCSPGTPLCSRWDREFESPLLQRRVCLSSEPRGCRRKAPQFGGGLRWLGT